MGQKRISVCLKVILIVATWCALGVYGWVIPSIGHGIIRSAPEYSSWYLPWLLFLLGTALPCLAALFPAWQILTSIGEGRCFTLANAARLKWIARLALGDTLYFFVGNGVFIVLNMNHPGVVLLSLLIDFVGVSIFVVCSALSTLVEQAASLQDQSDLTI